MKLFCFFLALLIIGLSCKKSDTSTKTCTDEQEEYVFETGRQILAERIASTDTLEHYKYTVSEGDKSVFNYTRVFEDCPEVADDEGSRIIVFEVPQNVNSFQIKDSADLRKAKALVNYACYCAVSGPIMIKQGLIEGKKTSDNGWRVKASLTPYLSNTVDFEADFILK